MYRYSPADRQFVHARAAQFRDQLTRHLAGELPDEHFRPLRLQNGWYIQRHAPMLRVAVPYGELASRQLRRLALVARTHDKGYGHFTTRQNLQFNWIPLTQAADVMESLAAQDLHGIQTSGNCIRNITTDALAGIATDEVADPRPFAELLRQWSTLHPEFAFLPRKFKIAITGADDDRAAIGWHDVGLHLRRAADGTLGFRVLVGGGMGRTPLIGQELTPHLPWADLVLYLEAVLRVYNRFGRRDNAFKARIKILVKAEGPRFAEAVNAEYAHILALDPTAPQRRLTPEALHTLQAAFADPAGLPASAHVPVQPPQPADAPPAYTRWLARNVAPQRLAGLRAVTLSLKRPGQAPGDVTAEQMEAAATLADRYSQGELRVTHTQNLLLPWVPVQDLYALWQQARAAGFATPNIGLVSDIIACPGGDYCALANARSLPIAEELAQRFDEPEELELLGPLALHISGCMNSCGHHHSGHIGILGIDKDGSEWYQLSVGGSDGSQGSGPARPGQIVGPAFAADEVADAVEAVIALCRRERQPTEWIVDTARRLGQRPLRAATDAVRRSTRAAHTDSAPEAEALAA
ncbi:MAG: nitrite/sulfite reductase [Proteobacteria bacterium]|nr:nitrite/sulfite reductase [Pseudomonadota bacterium]